MTDVYPRRGEQFFANRYLPHVFRSGVAMDICPLAVMLLTAVVMTEDKVRYSKGVRFWNEQLQAYLGCGEHRLISIRKRLVDAGWLHYQKGGNRQPGTYWVLTPDGVVLNDSVLGANADPEPTSETEFNCQSRQSNRQSNQPIEKVQLSVQTVEPTVEVTVEPTVILPIPIPLPEYKEGAVGKEENQAKAKKPAPAKAPPFDPLSVELPADLQTDRFRTAWANWCQHRRDIRKPLTPTATRQQLATLVAWGPERAVEAIETAINAGWSGVFEPKGKPTGTPAEVKSGPFAAVTKPMLRDSRALMAWFDGQSLIPVTHENRVWLLACAEKATDPEVKATNPVGLFVSLAKDLANEDRSKIGDDHYDRAKLRQKSLANPSPNRSGSTVNGPKSIGEVLAQ